MAGTAPSLKSLFEPKFNFSADKNTAEQIIRWRRAYEARGEHAEALNTPLLGVNRLGFFPKDSQALFDILGLDSTEVKRAIQASSIPSEWRVGSDEFNIITIWAIHKFLTASDKSVTPDLQTRTVRALVFMLQIKFFSSLVRNFIKFTPDRGLMEATIDSLTDKYDIKHPETNTWKLIMEKRCAELATPHNNHWDALINFGPDTGPKSVVYVITDLQTRLRMKIRLVAEVFYELVEQGKAIRDAGITTTDKEGDKVVKELRNSFDSMITSICNRCINAQTFIRSDFVTAASKLSANVQPNFVRNILMQFSAIAANQYAKGQGDDLDKTRTYYVGYHILISNIIQRTYRACILSKVNLKSRIAILKKAMDLYKSSRVNDPVIVMIKDSLDRFVRSTKISSRDATIASLKIAIIIYFILMSFDCD